MRGYMRQRMYGSRRRRGLWGPPRHGGGLWGPPRRHYGYWGTRRHSRGPFGYYPRRHGRSNVRVVGCCLPIPIGVLAALGLSLKLLRR